MRDGQRLEEYYRDRRVLVTGGLGFIGSNLVRRLVSLGSRVTVIDACFPDQGANLFNLEDVLEEVTLLVADIGATREVTECLPAQELVFNLAACVSHVGSLHHPLRDLKRNCLSQLRFLCLLAELNPGISVIYTGSRSQYGSPLYLPVDEDHPLRPVDINGIHKTAVEEYHRVLHDQGRIRYLSLRLTNVFGPRHQMMHDGQGFLNWFIRLGLQGKEIRVFGDGTQARDFLYVEDAVEALLLAAADPECRGTALNLASGKSITVAEAAQAVSEEAGTDWSLTPYPPERARVEPGDVVLDISRLRAILDWEPRWDFRAGLQETIAFYRMHGEHYFSPAKIKSSLTRKRPI